MSPLTSDKLSVSREAGIGSKEPRALMLEVNFTLKVSTHRKTCKVGITHAQNHR